MAVNFLFYCSELGTFTPCYESDLVITYSALFLNIKSVGASENRGEMKMKKENLPLKSSRLVPYAKRGTNNLVCACGFNHFALKLPNFPRKKDLQASFFLAFFVRFRH